MAHEDERKSLLIFATNDQLRAECERRRLAWPAQVAAFDAFKAERDAALAERDKWKSAYEHKAHLLGEWKRRAEVALAELDDAKRRISRVHVALRAALDAEAERGPGIVTRTMWNPTDDHWVDPLDLLADDA